jgi:putative transposase
MPRAQYQRGDVLRLNEAQELKRVREKNSKLKRVVADLTLDNMVLKDLLSKNW